MQCDIDNQKVLNLTNPVLSHVEKLVRLWWHRPWKSLIVKDYDCKEHQQSASYFTRDNCGKRTVHAVTFDKREELCEHWGQSCPYINAYIGKFSHLSIIPSKSGPEKRALFAQIIGLCISNRKKCTRIFCIFRQVFLVVLFSSFFLRKLFLPVAAILFWWQTFVFLTNKQWLATKKLQRKTLLRRLVHLVKYIRI